MTKPNNPPAFPTLRETGNAGNYTMQYEEGMTLRDWFAGQFMSGILSDPNFNKDCGETAELAYRQADAMLKERSK